MESQILDSRAAFSAFSLKANRKETDRGQRGKKQCAFGLDYEVTYCKFRFQMSSQTPENRGVAQGGGSHTGASGATLRGRFRPEYRVAARVAAGRSRDPGLSPKPALPQAGSHLRTQDREL